MMELGDHDATLRFEGRIEKVGPAVRVQSLWYRSPSPDEVDSFLKRYWPDDIDGAPLGENDHDVVVEGIPVEVTVRVPDWWVRRLARARKQLAEFAEALDPPSYLDLDEQDDWIEERSRALGLQYESSRILAELDAPGPTHAEMEHAAQPQRPRAP